MSGTKSLRSKSIGRWTTSKGEEEKRAPWWGYDELSGAGWYLYTPLKSEHQLDALTFPPTTIDYNSALHPLLRLILLAMQGALAALAPCRTPRPGSLERLPPTRVTFRTNTKQDADGTPALLPLGMGQADREGVRGRSADLPSLWIRDEAHSGHHQSFRSGYDPAPPHQDWSGTAGSRPQLPELSPFPVSSPA